MFDDYNIIRNGNHVYFNESINDKTTTALIRMLLDVDVDLSRIDDLTFIYLHICSGGGDIFCAFQIVDQIRQLHSPVRSIVNGVAASAATIISAGCTRRFITAHSLFMVHQISSSVWGTISEIEDEVFMGSIIMKKIVDFYKKHTHLRRKDIRHLLRRNSWFEAAECVRLGFADEIL